MGVSDRRRDKGSDRRREVSSGTTDLLSSHYSGLIGRELQQVDGAQ